MRTTEKKTKAPVRLQASKGRLVLNQDFLLHHPGKKKLTTDELVKAVHRVLPPESKVQTCFIACKHIKGSFTHVRWFASPAPGYYVPPVLDVLRWAAHGQRKFTVIRTCLHNQEFLKQYEDWFIKEFETGCRYTETIMEDYVALHQGQFVSYNRIHFFNTEPSFYKNIEATFNMKYPGANAL